MTTERFGNVELRWQEGDDGEREFDEFVVYNEAGECIVHGEAMSSGDYWIGLYLDPAPTSDSETFRACINLTARKKGVMEMSGRWE